MSSHLLRYLPLPILLIWCVLWLGLQQLNDGSRLVVNRDIEGHLKSIYTVDAKTNLQSQGRMLVYWPNGQVKTQADFDRGVYVGDFLEWHENGIPARRMQYALGREYGLQRGWRSDGGADFSYDMQDGRRFGVPGTMPCVVSLGDRKMALARYLRETGKVLAKPSGTRAYKLIAPELPMYNEASLVPRWSMSGAPAEHVVSNFSLLDHRSLRFDSSALTGHPTVVSFFFTGCTNLCPTTITQMKLLEMKLATQGTRGVNFVAMTVTPLQDDVKALAEYASRFDLGEAWHLVTGDVESVEQFAARSFFARSTTDVHTERAFLLDADKRIRGVYNVTQPADMTRLAQDAKKLSPVI